MSIIPFRLLDEFISDFDSLTPANAKRAEVNFSPDLDVVESEKDYKVHVELPGIDEKNIELSLKKNVLTIQGEKRFEKEESGKTFTRIERAYGTFYRSIPFKVELDDTKVEAHFKNGILSVTLPKAASALKQEKKIEIKSS